MSIADSPSASRARPETGPDPDSPARAPRALRAVVWLTIALALAVRVVVVREPAGVEWADGASYAEVAEHIADGSGIRNWRGVHTLWPPLYPALTATLSSIVGDVETAARLLSLGAGVATIVLSYLIAAALFGPVSGIFTALLVALQPELAQASLAVMTASAYTAAILGAFWVWLAAFGSLSVRRLLLVGLLLGAAYLLRPEALGFAALYPLLLLLKHGKHSRTRRRALIGSAALIAGALFFVLPYVLFLKTHTGQWALSGNAAYVLTLGDRRMGETAEERHYLLAPDGETVGLARGEMDDLIRERLANPVYYAKRYVRNLFREYRNLLGNQLHALLMLLIGVGLARGLWHERRWEKVSLLLALYSFFIFPANFIHSRYLIPLLPFALVFGGRGLAVSWGALSSWARARGRVGRLVLPSGVGGLILLLAIGYRFWFFEQPYWVGREERLAGEWIREDFGPGARIMERSHMAAFYADGYWLEVPYVPLDELLDYAGRQQADYLAISPGEGHPEVLSLIEPGATPSGRGLCLVHKVDPADGPDIWKPIYLFRLKPCDDAGMTSERRAEETRDPAAP